MHFKIVRQIKEIAKSDWQAIIGETFPFVEYDFLYLLEKSACVGEEAGWKPHYLTLWQEKMLVAATFLYEKDHGYGEYIFDWQWAEAYQANAKAYFPKMVSSIPFSPVTGRKMLIHPSWQDQEKELCERLLKESLRLSKEFSSLHFLFILEEQVEAFRQMGFMIRHSSQFHWQNRDYKNFDYFLQSLKRKRRQQISKERRDVLTQGIEIHRLTGEDIKPEHADLMYQFYISTLKKKWAMAYLSQEFFQDIFQALSDQILLLFAKKDGVWVAGTLNFFKGDRLYGRYWGCQQGFRSLHFELCYYQNIEFAIEKGISVFEAGAQGEHKLFRGLLPTRTLSAHWIKDKRFRQAIGQFIDAEKKGLADLFETYDRHDPYKPQ